MKIIMTHHGQYFIFLGQKIKKGGLGLSFWLLGLGLIRGQPYENLVPNPSFEQHSRCPSFLGGVRSYNINSSYGLVNDWVANPPDCTPDYYHACGKKGFGLPKNLTGFQVPREGKAYIGMIMRIGEVPTGPLSDLFYREHVSTRLVRPLQKDYQYRVSFGFRFPSIHAMPWMAWELCLPKDLSSSGKMSLLRRKLSIGAGICSRQRLG
ncbi:MAG: hypothetical protein HC913_05930 [Microscillaceae bacterium]|nr:hypothetical protein [Microscillaceae bacterium]